MIVVHANYLASIGHEVRIIASVIDTVFELNPAVKLVKLPKQNKVNTIISALTTKFHSDIVIADIVAMVLFLSIRNRKNTICFAQDYDESYYSNPLQKALIRIIYFITLSVFKIKVIAVSDPLGSLLRRRFKANTFVVQNGVDMEVFSPIHDPLLHSLKEGRKAILLLSRSDWRKGFDLSQQIVARIPAEFNSHLEIWTVGESVTDVFKGFIHRDFGYVNETFLCRLMSSADMLLYPTRHEGFPLMPLEAFACKCPVVTTVAVPYAINYKNSLVSQIENVDDLLGNTLLLLNDNALRAQIVDCAHSYAVANTLSASSVNFTAALESIL